MPGFLSRLLGKHREPITIRARKAVISGNVLIDGSRPINVEADEVHLIGNKSNDTIPEPPWYQRPIGYVTLTVAAGLIVLLVWAVLALEGTSPPK